MKKVRCLLIVCCILLCGCGNDKNYISSEECVTQFVDEYKKIDTSKTDSESILSNEIHYTYLSDRLSRISNEYDNTMSDETKEAFNEYIQEYITPEQFNDVLDYISISESESLDDISQDLIDLYSE